jgi:hypothetical protein
MAASTQAQVHDGASGDGSATTEPLDVVPLLKAYSAALQLSRRPPPSLKLPAALTRLHLILRPTFGCHYFATRHVRRRTEALERALAARLAIGEADDNDPAELEALQTFKSSLAPPPSRGWTVALLIGAILLTQVLIERLLRLVVTISKNTSSSRIDRAFSEISLSPDVESIGGLGRALTSANLLELAVVVLSAACVVYFFGRPFASGYRLAQLCLNPNEPARRLRRHSTLCRQAALAAIPPQEARVARVSGNPFGRGVPLDIIVKAAPSIAAGFLLILYTRIWEDIDGPATTVAIWAAVSAAVLVFLVLLPRLITRTDTTAWRIVRVLLALGGMTLAFELLVSPSETSPGHIWLGVVALTSLHLAWLMRHARLRGQSPLYIGIPLAVILAIGVIAPVDIFGTGSRESALTYQHLAGVPQVSRPDLQLLLASSMHFPGADLRTQDLHDLSLRGKRLTDAQFDLANLRGTDLQHANLRGAELFGAQARHANLRHARLQNANLRCADLRDADLRGANLSGAAFAKAVTNDSTQWPRGFDASDHDILDWDDISDSANNSFYEYVSFCR